jgi:hypothetical protein
MHIRAAGAGGIEKMPFGLIHDLSLTGKSPGEKAGVSAYSKFSQIPDYA